MTDDTQLWAAVTCHTVDCGNAGITITVPTSGPAGLVICGPCGQQITDMVQTAPPEGVL